MCPAQGPVWTFPQVWSMWGQILLTDLHVLLSVKLKVGDPHHRRASHISSSLCITRLCFDASAAVYGKTGVFAVWCWLFMLVWAAGGLCSSLLMRRWIKTLCQIFLCWLRSAVFWWRVSVQSLNSWYQHWIQQCRAAVQGLAMFIRLALDGAVCWKPSNLDGRNWMETKYLLYRSWTLPAPTCGCVGLPPFQPQRQMMCSLHGTPGNTLTFSNLLSKFY